MGAGMRMSRCDERICRVQGELMFCGGSLSLKDLGDIIYALILLMTMSYNHGLQYPQK
jgi:hypothetical protein